MLLPYDEFTSEPPTTWSIFCDFDGTITDVDVTDSLLQRFADPAWEAVEAEWKSGRIGSRDCMAQQVALIDAELHEIDEHLATISIDPGFSRFVDVCSARGFPLLILSDGIDYALRAVLDANGLGHVPFLANRLRRAGERGYRLESPHASELCSVAAGTCKCVAMHDARGARRNLLIGDGASDFCGAASADFVFAKKSLLEYCRRNHIAHAPFAGFTEVLAVMDEVLDVAGTE